MRSTHTRDGRPSAHTSISDSRPPQHHQPPLPRSRLRLSNARGHRAPRPSIHASLLPRRWARDGELSFPPTHALCQARRANHLHSLLPSSSSPQFKIEPRIRSHNILSRDTIINTLASYISRRPNGWRCDLKKPDVWVSVEVHKSQAALGACRDFLRFSKLNPLELANAVKGRRGEGGAAAAGKKGEEVKGEGKEGKKEEEEKAAEPAAAAKDDEPAAVAAAVVEPAA